MGSVPFGTQGVFRPRGGAEGFPLWRAGEPPTKVGGLREDILFESKEYPLALPKKDCQGGFRFPP